MQLFGIHDYPDALTHYGQSGLFFLGKQHALVLLQFHAVFVCESLSFFINKLADIIELELILLKIDL